MSGALATISPQEILGVHDAHDVVDITCVVWVAGLGPSSQNFLNFFGAYSHPQPITLTRGTIAVTPLIQRRTVSMPPALTIMSQIVLGVLVGGIGVAVAPPLTAAAMTMVRMLYVEDLLEQDAPAERMPATVTETAWTA